MEVYRVRMADKKVTEGPQHAMLMVLNESRAFCFLSGWLWRIVQSTEEEEHQASKQQLAKLSGLDFMGVHACHQHA